jgi:hypothetical protein
MEERRVRDVEEFELGALLDEDEEAEEAVKLRGSSSASDENAPLAKQTSIDHQ